jgi:hypothetical protein
MNYAQLSIHQKINAKANSLVIYKGKSWSYERLIKRHAGIFSPMLLMFELEGIHNNRNYDGPQDREAWSGGIADNH